MTSVIRLTILIAFVFTIFACSKEKNMKELGFDIGGSVEQTLRSHNVPYKGQNTDGYVDYGYIGFPDGVVTAVFKRPGMDIRIFPVYAMTFYSDDRLSPPSTIATADISMTRSLLRSHEKAYAATLNLIEQFQRGKWQGFISDSCPRVTGRSTLLGLSGTSEDRRVACPIDPSIKLTLEEFSQFSGEGLVWMWIAEDRIAKLEVDSSTRSDSDDPSYSINLSFELKDAYEFYDEQWYIERKEDIGEAAFQEAEKLGKSELKQLEEAAIKRGDSVLPK
jgi:hypothetical protein